MIFQKKYVTRFDAVILINYDNNIDPFDYLRVISFVRKCINTFKDISWSFICNDNGPSGPFVSSIT